MTILRRQSLRLRVFLFFALIAIAGLAVFGAGLYLGQQRGESGFLLAEIIGGFGLIAVVTWVWFMFDEHVARPIQRLSGALLARAHADTGEDIDPTMAKYLGDLAPAAQQIATKLASSRNALAESIALETTRLIDQREQLAAIGAALPIGVLVCSGSHRVVFYNGAAAEILSDDHAPGLDHSIFDFLQPSGILDAYARLCSDTEAGNSSTTFLTSTTTASRTLSAHLRLVHAPTDTDKSPGYLLTLEDVTQDILNDTDSRARILDVLDAMRPALVSVETSLRLREDTPSLAHNLELTEAIVSRTGSLIRSVHQLYDVQSHQIRRVWPQETVAPMPFLRDIAARFRVANISTDTLRQAPLRLAPLPMSALIEHLLTRIYHAHGGKVLSLLISDEADDPMLVIGWSGAALSIDVLDQWLNEQLTIGVAGVTGRMVLEMHHTDVWPEFGRLGRSVLRLPLPKPLTHHRPNPRRMVTYDFDLMETAPDQSLITAPLSGLAYVVFDTETTGLLPAQGDEMCQLAAVRIVNGRILRTETLDMLINPGRAIPKSATAVHHITNEMVADAPAPLAAAQSMLSFARDAILVAHNAPFDMEFLRRQEPHLPGRFDHPIIDTVLLSAVVFGQEAEHTLDAICGRLGIEIPSHLRHTAMGDTIATADAFLRMITMAQSKGITTFGQLVEATRKHKRLIQDLNSQLEI